MSHNKLFSDEFINAASHDRRPLVVDLNGILIHAGIIQVVAVRIVKSIDAKK